MASGATRWQARDAAATSRQATGGSDPGSHPREVQTGPAGTVDHHGVGEEAGGRRADTAKLEPTSTLKSVLDAAWMLRTPLTDLTDSARAFLVAAAQAAAARWSEDDQAIWEMRGRPRSRGEMA